MREILFRGKKEDGEWVDGHYFKSGLNTYITTVKTEVGTICIKSHKVNPETVGQYTGLQDFNDNKIFEGDIVFNNLLEEYGVVIFFENGFAVSFAGEIVNCIEAFEQNEVVGNIYDNVELIV